MVDAGAVDGERRRRAILAEIAAIGPVLPGCIIERRTRCQTSGCRCRAEPPELHGPYLTWTHREEGRQVTRTISPEVAERLRPLIDNDRRLRQLVTELEQLTATSIAGERAALGRPAGPKSQDLKKGLNSVGKLTAQAGDRL
jgi:hypothetical protein